jgi:hypothetical protein
MKQVDLRSLGSAQTRRVGNPTDGTDRCSRLLPILDGSAGQPKVVGRREHVAVVGPHVAFTGVPVQS